MPDLSLSMRAHCRPDPTTEVLLKTPRNAQHCPSDLWAAPPTRTPARLGSGSRRGLQLHVPARGSCAVRLCSHGLLAAGRALPDPKPSHVHRPQVEPTPARALLPRHTLTVSARNTLCLTRSPQAHGTLDLQRKTFNHGGATQTTWAAAPPHACIPGVTGRGPGVSRRGRGSALCPHETQEERNERSC